MPECDELVDLAHGTVSPRVLTDPDVYRVEQESTFARWRSWARIKMLGL